MEQEKEMMACAAGQVDVAGVPEEVRLLPMGLVHNTRQDFLVDDESCQLIIRQFKDRRLDLVIDYEHQTLKGTQAPAGGWIKDIRKGEGALVAKVEWTQKAKEYLASKEYRYLSPVVMVRKSDHKAVALHSAALTNTPAIDGMFAIVNSAGFPAGGGEEQGGEEMEFLKKLAAALGLPETATEADVASAVEALAKKNAEIVANSTVLTMLGLKEDAKTEDVAAKIQQLANGSGMAAELAALKESLAKREAGEAVAAAMKEGKVSAAQKEWAESYALKDPEGFAAFCEKAAPVVPMGKNVSAGDRDPVGKKSEMDAVVLKNMGLTKEDIEKYAEGEGE